ncbi:MAG: TIR domain-containing protein, partial [Gammaproteobacteria bacterium]|nr:TIR domain-containing protein [Gammaproteobacteria bacterium]
QIKDSDFLVVLLSEASADSEMVKAEIKRAYEYRKLQDRPYTLPVRVAYEGLLPYSIDAFLDPLQYVVWHNEADNHRVSDEILAAIAGRLPQKLPTTSDSGHIVLSEDGGVIDDGETLPPPLPEFDPRFLEELQAPGGVVKLRDDFYIERRGDEQLRREIIKMGTTTT